MDLLVTSLLLLGASSADLAKAIKAKAEGRTVGQYRRPYIPHVCSSAAMTAASLETTISSG